LDPSAIRRHPRVDTILKPSRATFTVRNDAHEDGYVVRSSPYQRAATVALTTIHAAFLEAGAHHAIRDLSIVNGWRITLGRIRISHFP
jgi:hypothetical protein